MVFFSDVPDDRWQPTTENSFCSQLSLSNLSLNLRVLVKIKVRLQKVIGLSTKLCLNTKNNVFSERMRMPWLFLERLPGVNFTYFVDLLTKGNKTWTGDHRPAKQKIEPVFLAFWEQKRNRNCKQSDWTVVQNSWNSLVLIVTSSVERHNSEMVRCRWYKSLVQQN